MDTEVISQGASFLSNMGGNLATVALVGGGYFLYRVCGGSKCGYTSKEGFNIEFGNNEHDDDSEDETMKEMIKLMVKRKSIKVKKKTESLSEDDKVPTIRIPIELKSDI